ncbi:MAG: hypothetical protein ACE5GX_10860 [Thermoanaerobaculia bacterium]
MQPHIPSRIWPFLGLTLGWSWVFFLITVPRYRAAGVDGAGLGVYLPLLLGAYGPSLMAIALTARGDTPLFFAPAGTSISGKPITVTTLALYAATLVGLSVVIVWLSLRSGTHFLTGFLVHLGFNAEIYRFFFEHLADGRETIERWALIPMWGLIVWLAATGRLERSRSASPKSG